MSASLLLHDRAAAALPRERPAPRPFSPPALTLSASPSLWLSLPVLLPLLMMPERATLPTLAPILVAMAVLVGGASLITDGLARLVGRGDAARHRVMVAIAGVLLIAAVGAAAYATGDGTALVIGLAVAAMALRRRIGPTSPLAGSVLAALAAGLAFEAGLAALDAPRGVLVVLLVMVVALAADLAQQRSRGCGARPRAGGRAVMARDLVLGSALFLALGLELSLAGASSPSLGTLLIVAFSGLGFLRLWQRASSLSGAPLAADPWLQACLAGWGLSAGALLPATTLPLG